MNRKHKAVTPPKKRGRPKVTPDALQRERIIDRTRRLLLRQGYARTTTDQIASACHVSKNTLYRLFPEKLAIFEAIVDAHRNEMLALPGEYDDIPIDVALKKIFRIDIDAQAHKERVAILNLTLAEAPLFPELKSVMYKRGAVRSHAELSRWLSQQAGKGKMSIKHPDRDAHILMDMVFGPILRKTIGAFHTKDNVIAEHIGRCVDIFLNGVVRSTDRDRGASKD